MMGSLVRRKNGVYYAIFSRRGRRLWRSTGARTAEEARRRYHELEAEFESPGRITLQGFTDELLGILPGRLAGSTIQLYASALRKLREFCGNRKMGAISALDAERFIAARLREVSPVKASIDLRTLRAAFGRAQALGFVEENPFRNVAPVRIPERPPAVLRLSDLPSLLGATGSAQMKAIIVLALATGMRLGELLSLRREDVDLERGIIHVRNRGAFCTKNRRSRMVPMNRTARRILEPEPRRSPYVFTSRRGDRLSVNWISKRFRAVARKAGLPESLHFHSLRHAAASWLIEEGAPLTHIREILGHSSIAVTTVYAHTIERALSQSIALVDPLLSETAAVAPVHPGEPVPGSLLGQKVDR